MNYRRAMCVTDYRGILTIDRRPGRTWSAAVAALLALSGMLYIENVSMADGPCDQCNGILAEIKTLEKEVERLHQEYERIDREIGLGNPSFREEYKRAQVKYLDAKRKFDEIKEQINPSSSEAEIDGGYTVRTETTDKGTRKTTILDQRGKPVRSAQVGRKTIYSGEEETPLSRAYRDAEKELRAATKEFQRLQDRVDKADEMQRSANERNEATKRRIDQLDAKLQKCQKQHCKD